MCAFINFTHLPSAIAAKEDVLGRRQGLLFPTSTSQVRIGFGKPESVPNTPAQLTATTIDSSLQNSPTRALWVGALPENITSYDLVSLFEQFGTIESVRVLSHKGCGESCSACCTSV